MLAATGWLPIGTAAGTEDSGPCPFGTRYFWNTVNNVLFGSCPPRAAGVVATCSGMAAPALVPTVLTTAVGDGVPEMGS